jgi:hypothetical protein
MTVNFNGEDLLYNLAYECESHFDQLLEIYQERKAEVTTIELCAEFQQRFAIWTAHLGVFARKSQCLDTRLRNFPDLQDLVARLLDILRHGLQQCLGETSGQGRPLPTSLSEYPPSATQTQTATLRIIDDTITRLNRLGVTIRQSSKSKIDIRAKKFAAGLNLNAFEYLCANAVQALYPGAHQSLKDYLSKSMTDRYSRTLFLNYRNQKLRTRRAPTISLPTISEVPNMPTTQLARAIEDPVVLNLRRTHPTPHLTPSLSDLSSVNIQQIRSRLRPPDVASTNFHKTSSIQVNHGNYPQRPVTKEGSNIFTCQWCGEQLNEEISSEHAWRYV